MKKICFVSYVNLYLTPYIRNYMQNIKGDFDVILWDRHGIDEKIDGGNIIAFHKNIEDNKSSKLKKLQGYLQYARVVNRNLKEKNYDIVIFLQSIGAVFSQKILLKKYAKRYIIDIRDFSIEKTPILKSIEFKLLRHSCLNVISSDGYKEFLPSNTTYQLVHNYLGIRQEELNDFVVKRKVAPIRMSYIGLIRFQEQNKKIIDLFGNDSRFELSFIGKNADELKGYVTEKKITNICLIDQFDPKQTLEYYKKTDVILNAYGNHKPLLDYALSNKLYYAAALRIPICVSKDTYMERKAVFGGFGFTLDFHDSEIKEKLIQYLNDLNLEEFEEKCKIFIQKVEKDNVAFNEVVKALLN